MDEATTAAACHLLDAVLDVVHVVGRTQLVQVANERPNDDDLHDAGENEERPDADIRNALVGDESSDDHEHVDLHVREVYAGNSRPMQNIFTSDACRKAWALTIQMKKTCTAKLQAGAQYTPGVGGVSYACLRSRLLSYLGDLDPGKHAEVNKQHGRADYPICELDDIDVGHCRQ